MSEETARRIQEGLIVRGNTFPHRFEIKAIGGIWSPALKAWLLPNADACIKVGAQFRCNKQGTAWWIAGGKKRGKSRRKKSPTTSHHAQAHA